MNDQPFCVLSVIGPHAGESMPQIFARKLEDIACCGFTYWLGRSYGCSPQQFASLQAEQDITCYFLEPAVPGGARPTTEAGIAYEYFANDCWHPLNQHLSPVTGKVSDGRAWALVLKSIAFPVADTINLNAFTDLRGGIQVKFKLGYSTVLANPSAPSDAVKLRKVAAVATLAFPFCVRVR